MASSSQFKTALSIEMSVVAVAVVALLLAAQLLNRTSENIKNEQTSKSSFLT